MSTEGIDVSSYQAATPPLTGLSFLIAKASEGRQADPLYPSHIDNARRAGLVVGAFHFGIGGDPVGQAAYFLHQAGAVGILALDLESSANPMSQAEARSFIAAVHAAGRRIGLYASESGFPTLGQDFNWVANWSSRPSIPWTFHQYRGSPLDLDRFNGSAAELSAFSQQEPDMPGLGFKIVAPFAGTVTVTGPGHALLRVRDGAYIQVPDGQVREAIATVALLKPLDALPGDRTNGYLVGKTTAEATNWEAGFHLAVDVTPQPAPAADCAAAVTSERERVRAVIIAAAQSF